MIYILNPLCFALDQAQMCFVVCMYMYMLHLCVVMYECNLNIVYEGEADSTLELYIFNVHQFILLSLVIYSIGNIMRKKDIM